ILEARLLKKPGSLRSLRNEDLMPPGQPSVGRLIKELLPEFEMPDQLGSRNRRRGVERRHAELRQKLIEKGVDPDKHPPPLPPDVRIDMNDVDGTLAGVDEAMAEAKAQQESAKAELAARVEEAKKKLEAQGVDYDDAMKKARDAQAGPPKQDPEG